MFRKTDTNEQLDIFSSPSTYMKGRTAKKYEDPHAWHNEFYQYVTSKIDEETFRPLFKEGNMGAPNASIRILVAMSILKEGFGCSDEDLFEKCEFDLLARKALGMGTLEDAAPSIDTYYLFRRRICDYEKEKGVNLMEKCFGQVTGEQVKVFKISGRSVRMDSKQIGSNIAWYSRYEIVHATLRKEMNEFTLPSLNPSLRKKVEEALTEDAQKTVYRTDSDTMAVRFQELGQLIYSILVRLKWDETHLLHRVFHEQYNVEHGKAIAKDKKDIKASSVQNPNDPDAGYRSKNGKKNKGYNTNLTETTDEEDKPSLIVGVQVESATAADNSFVEDAIKKAEEVTGNKVTTLYSDSAYQSPSNRKFAETEQIKFVANGIQGKRSRFDLTDLLSKHQVLDRNTGELIDAVLTKGGKWKVKLSEGKTRLRYFAQEVIDRFLTRMQIEATPLEERNKRNNVEASIFQYCFHTRNNKTRYRGLLKTKLFSYCRCMWMNMRRIQLFEITMCQRA